PRYGGRRPRAPRRGCGGGAAPTGDRSRRSGTAAHVGLRGRCATHRATPEDSAVARRRPPVLSLCSASAGAPCHRRPLGRPPARRAVQWFIGLKKKGAHIFYTTVSTPPDPF